MEYPVGKNNVALDKTNTLANPLKIASTALKPQGYYRSKLFVASLSSNLLVAAAGPLLSLLERLCLTTQLPPVEHIRGNIEHELQAFHSKLFAAQYAVDLSNIAYYIVCATVDEMLAKSYLRLYDEAPTFTAFTPLTPNDNAPQERFFAILDYIKERPNQYLDLIELMYFCLIVGFEGMYHQKAEGRQVLDNYIEKLFQLIQQHRYNKPYRLFNDNPLIKPNKKEYKTTVLTALVFFGLLTIAYLSSHFLLENKAKSVLFGQTQLAMLD